MMTGFDEPRSGSSTSSGGKTEGAFGFEYSQNDTTVIVQTPEGIEFILSPAGFPIRACAWAIDSFIQGILVFTILFILVLTSEVMGTWFSLILAFILNWFYHTAFEIFCRGQSPGKKIMGIRVVRGDGSPVDPGAAFLRNLLRFADTFLSLYLIGFICMLVSPGFRRFGDWAADTLVVYTANTPGNFTSRTFRKRAMPWPDVPLVFPDRPLGYGEKQAILMFANRFPLLGKARADEIAGIWVDELCGAGNKAASMDSNTGSSASACLIGIARTIGG